MSLPLIYDRATKNISIDEEKESFSVEISEDVNQLNRLAKDLISISSEIPESPEPSKALNPMIQKLVSSGVQSLQKKNLNDAIKQLTLAIAMAGRRARWEAFSVQLQELHGIIQLRCDAYLINKQFAEAYNDADLLLGTQVNTAENFLRRSVAALNLGRLAASKADVERGLCFHPANEKLKEQLKNVNRAIDIENGDVLAA